MTPKSSLRVRDIMSRDVECAGSHDTLQHAAQRMRDLNVGALPICGDDDKLHGMLTDRDIVVTGVAFGKDVTTVEVGDLVDDRVLTVDADDDVRAALRTMAQYRVRRLPVLENRRLVGIIAQADLARNIPEEFVGELVGAISEP